jgi:hypothetical protein
VSTRSCLSAMVEHARGVPGQRPHDPDPREHRRAAVVRDSRASIAANHTAVSCSVFGSFVM